MATEKRLIDANELIENAQWFEEYIEGQEVAFKYIDLEDVENAHTVDAVEVVHGRWEDMYDGKYDNHRFRCSVCKEKSLFKDKRDVLGNWIQVQALTDYCPNCGAKMGGDWNG